MNEELFALTEYNKKLQRELQSSEEEKTYSDQVASELLTRCKLLEKENDELQNKLQISLAREKEFL